VILNAFVHAKFLRNDVMTNKLRTTVRKFLNLNSKTVKVAEVNKVKITVLK